MGEPTAEAVVEALSARLHEVYQAEAHRRGDVRHHDDYEALPDATKEWDRVLARWILAHWEPRFDVAEGFPPALTDGGFGTAVRFFLGEGSRLDRRPNEPAG